MQTRPKADVEQATRRHIAAIIQAVGEGKPDPNPPQILHAPCDGPNGETASDGRYYVSGLSHITLPGEQHRAVVTQARDKLQAQGYQVDEYRDLPTPTGAELRLSDPQDGSSVTLASSGDRIWLALIVRSACILPPDGNYPD
ncbi:hypothetical protein [Micromonospora sp. NPDC048839]|uniref:hypothetical protein n=1 Tax=Micromonospora sp. NPDC048839 TaxID=3155641 RepID=UPI0033F43A1E